MVVVVVGGMTHLAAELEVTHHDGDLCAGDGQDDEHQEEEPEQVVELVQPDGRPGDDQRQQERGEGVRRRASAGE